MADNIQHEDFGEKIGGAKKDLWKDRGLYVNDLDAMNEREAEIFVKKDNIWKKPDYQAMLDDGIPLGVVYFIKKVRDGLNASPQYYRRDDTPEKRLARQKEYILSLCDLIIGGKEGLSPIERTIIDRCTRLVYRDYLQNPRPENMPVLGDLYELLLKQAEPEAQNIATALEIYVNGSLNVFNHRSNIDMNNHRVLCFQLKSLGKALKEIGLLIMQDAVWNRVTANRSKHKTTWFYIDEFHLLLKGQTGSFSVEIWKRFRKWGGIPSGLTQNVKDLLASREIENIFENSDFIYMLNQAQGDRQILAKQLGISPHQLSYVTHSGPGEGLLFFGNVIIPFVDHFPKDTLLYSVLTTRPDEVAGA